jgi:hypothetical protein
MSDSKSDFDSELNPDFWREYIEERERLSQLRDEAVARQFWALKSQLV